MAVVPAAAMHSPRREGSLRPSVTELKLFVREPVVLIFVFPFPVLTVLVPGGCSTMTTQA
jgi:hypothetical protein